MMKCKIIKVILITTLLISSYLSSANIIKKNANIKLKARDINNNEIDLETLTLDISRNKQSFENLLG